MKNKSKIKNILTISLISATMTSGLQATEMENVAGLGVNTSRGIYSLSDSMYTRVGELLWQYNNKENGINHKNNAFWAKTNIGRYTISRTGSNDNKVKNTLPVFEFGYDRMVFNGESGKGFVGALAQFSKSSPTATDRAKIKSDLDMRTKSLGLYGMWLGKGGYFADLVVRQHIIEQRADTLNVKYKSKQNATTASLELGRELVFDNGAKELERYLAYKLIRIKDNNQGNKIAKSSVKALDDFINFKPEIASNSSYGEYFFIPKIKFDVFHIGADKVNINNTSIKIRDNNTYTFSSGFMFGKRFMNLEDENSLKTQFYGKVNYLYETNSQVKLTSNTLRDKIKNKGGRLELGIGFDAKFNKMFSLYVDGTYQFNSDYKDLGATIGGRWEF